MDKAATPELYKHAKKHFFPVNIMTFRIAMRYIYRHVYSFTAPQTICKSTWLSCKWAGSPRNGLSSYATSNAAFEFSLKCGCMMASLTRQFNRLPLWTF